MNFRHRLHPGHLADLLSAWDPKLTRLRTAIRVTLTAALSLWVLSQFAGLVNQPITVAFIGIEIGVMASQLPDRPLDWLIAPLLAGALLSAGTVAATNEWFSSAGLTVIAFGAIYARRFGSRGNALGLLGFLSLPQYFSAPRSPLCHG